jgi:hypothetical protein
MWVCLLPSTLRPPFFRSPSSGVGIGEDDGKTLNPRPEFEMPL